MLPWDSRWRRLRRRLRPVTTRIPGGHVVTEAATYARLAVPVVPRPERRFVVFAQGRSGSTLLTDLVNSHPDIFCDDEVLTFPRRWPERYVAALSVGQRRPVWGFKVKIYQLTEAQGMDEPGRFLRELHRRGWQVVHLRRRNVVRQALSSMVAEARGGLYHQASGAGRAGDVTIDVEDLLRRARQRVDFGEQEADALRGIPHLALVYEDDLLDPRCHQPTADRVFAHLGVAPAPVATVLTKLAPAPLAGVTNADEVAAAVAASPFGGALDGD